MDIWSVGCILGGLIFRISYLFIGKDNYDQLVEIVKTFGKQEFDKYIDKYKVTLEPSFYNMIPNCKKQPFEAFINEDN